MILRNIIEDLRRDARRVGVEIDKLLLLRLLTLDRLAVNVVKANGANEISDRRLDERYEAEAAMLLLRIIHLEHGVLD